MSDLKGNQNCFREAVCIETQRIYDSCSDKDCLEDLVLQFDEGSQLVINNATYIKSKCVEVTNVLFAIEPVPFNKGFYSIDLTYYFNVILEAYETSTSVAVPVTATTEFTKKVILYGSEGNTKIFSSDSTDNSSVSLCSCFENLPKATAKVVEPIILDYKLVSKMPHPTCCECCSTSSNGSGCITPVTNKCVYITIGMFTIIQVSRPVSLLIPSYEFCIPEKDCTTTNDSPCEMFEKIKFPVNEFFPPSLDELD